MIFVPKIPLSLAAIEQPNVQNFLVIQREDSVISMEDKF